MTTEIQKRTREESDETYGTEHLTEWSPPDPARATLILVHGLAEHAGRYDRTGRLLAGRGLEVIAPDLFGFGQSGGTRGDVLDWEHYWDQVTRLVENARVNSDAPVILMGHSMGGLIAASYGLSSRPQPELLILSAPAIGGGAWWQRALAPVLAAVAPKMAIPNNLSGDQLSRDPDVGEAYFADPLVYTKTTARLGNELFAAQGRVASEIQNWHIPTLVLHGGADTVVPARSTAPLADLPTVERRLYPRLRHEILNEPEGPELVAEIADWLDERITASG